MRLTNYWWLLIWIFIAGGFLYWFFPREKVWVNGKYEERWSWLSVFLLVFPYILWAGFRSDSYGDTVVYRNAYLNAPTIFGEWIQYIELQSKDKGFSVLTVLLRTLLGNSDKLYFLIIAAIQIVLIIYVYRKYSCNFWMSFFLFVASTDYISWMHNGMRQFLAVALIFAATDLILEKKYIKTIIVILLASTLHASALLMIPIIFIVQGKAWNKKTILFLLAALIAITYVDRFTDILDIMLNDTQYTNVVQDWKDMNDDGTNPVRVLVYAIPTILSLFGFKYIKEADEKIVNLAVNMSICSVTFWLVSMVTSGILIGRLPVYMGLYATGILLPWELKNYFTVGSYKIVSVIAVVAYIMFFYYQMHFAWGLI